ncbi:MerR family transcriptional regulator [Roseovarius sp. SYSU LYC5161]|uniref:MerR family transcriptional regulator n=1 Tax=Roseovarius halophilus (ex Wu et al. 2025) TaxID=3376060 RepID=UPI00399C422C
MAKSADAFRTISEVADWLETPAHVLRFWESKFSQIKPVKRAGGRRYYRPSDMQLLGGIKKLLHDDGMTIKGVQKVLREQGVKHVAAFSQPLDGTITIDTDPIGTDAPEDTSMNVVDMQTRANAAADEESAPGSQSSSFDDADDRADAPEDSVVPAAGLGEDPDTTSASAPDLFSVAAQPSDETPTLEPGDDAQPSDPAVSSEENMQAEAAPQDPLSVRAEETPPTDDPTTVSQARTTDEADAGSAETDAEQTADEQTLPVGNETGSAKKFKLPDLPPDPSDDVTGPEGILTKLHKLQGNLTPAVFGDAQNLLKRLQRIAQGDGPNTRDNG